MSRCKRVTTKDPTGKPNGYLLELDVVGRKTKAYLTVAYPNCFKGYHAHRVRESNYVCIRGEIKVRQVKRDGVKDTIMNAEQAERLNIPLDTPTAIINEGEEEAWLINFPDPPYDSWLKDEQIDLKVIIIF